jgi:hypothetical protein
VYAGALFQAEHAATPEIREAAGVIRGLRDGEFFGPVL